MRFKTKSLISSIYLSLLYFLRKPVSRRLAPAFDVRSNVQVMSRQDREKRRRSRTEEEAEEEEEEEEREKERERETQEKKEKEEKE